MRDWREEFQLACLCDQPRTPYEQALREYRDACFAGDAGGAADAYAKASDLMPIDGRDGRFREWFLPELMAIGCRVIAGRRLEKRKERRDEKV